MTVCIVFIDRIVRYVWVSAMSVYILLLTYKDNTDIHIYTRARGNTDISNPAHPGRGLRFVPAPIGTQPDEWDESQWRAYQQEMQKFEAEARAAGFATLDEYLDVQMMRAVEERPS